jgi:hypothetical protein
MNILLIYFGLLNGAFSNSDYAASNAGMMSPIFWEITLCNLLKVNRRFGGTYRLHLQSRRINEARNQHEASSNIVNSRHGGLGSSQGQIIWDLW